MSEQTEVKTAEQRKRDLVAALIRIREKGEDPARRNLNAPDGFYYDAEQAHWDADVALLDYIGDDDVAEAFHAIDKWYS